MDCTAAVAAATAAERARRMGWQRPGVAGVVDLSFSDPKGLLSSYALDPDTGIFSATARAGVQTAVLSEWAGWEGRLPGAVDEVFFTNALGITARLQRDVSKTHPAACDLAFGVYVMNGPRSTASYLFGGGWRHPGAANQWRPEAYSLRAGSPGSGASTVDQVHETLLVGCTIGNTFNTAARACNSSGAILGGSSNLGAVASNGTFFSQNAWGEETWVFFGVGRRVGDSVAPNDDEIEVRALADINYPAPNWTWESISP